MMLLPGLQGSVEGGPMAPQQAGNLGHGLALPLDEMAGMSDLLGREGEARPKAHTARLSRHPAGACAFHDQGPLEISHASEHGQYHAPGRRRGIGPRLGERAQSLAGFLHPLGDLQQVAGKAGEPVQARDCHHVADAQVVEQPPQFGPVALCPADLFLENPRAAGFAKCRALLGEVLTLGGDAGIADHRTGWVRIGPGFSCRSLCRELFTMCDKDTRQESPMRTGKKRKRRRFYNLRDKPLQWSGGSSGRFAMAWSGRKRTDGFVRRSTVKQTFSSGASAIGSSAAPTPFLLLHC
jgi:hypothetical protein